MNAQQKIQKILQTVWANAEVGAKLSDVNHGMLGLEERGYPVVAGDEKFYVRSVRHAREIIEVETQSREYRERTAEYWRNNLPVGLARALGKGQ